MKKPLLYFLALIFTFQIAQAQDLHFSYFQFQPIQLNPALTGAFEGTARIGGIYRDQRRQVSSAPISTPSAYVDAPIIRGFGKMDWIGIGSSFYSDNQSFGFIDGAGNNMSGSINKVHTSLNAAYHLSLDKKRNNVLAFGFQFGRVTRRFGNGAGGVLFPDQLPGFNVTMENPSTFTGFMEGDNTSYTDLTAGITFRANGGKKSNFAFGLTMAHLTQGDQSLAQNGRDELDRRITGFFQLNASLTDKLAISPAILYQKQGAGNEMLMQAILGYRLNEEKDLTLNGGLGYRFGDAANLYAGVQKGNLRVGVSYDVTLSNLAIADNNQGAFELGVSYIIKLFKKPNPDPVIFCPRF